MMRKNINVVFGNNHFSLNDFQVGSAQVEVHLLNKYDDLNARLHQIELSNLTKDGSLKNIFEDVKQIEYKNILDKVTVMSALRTKMKI